MHEKHIDQLSLFHKRGDHNAKQDWNYGNKSMSRKIKNNDSLFDEDILMQYLTSTLWKHHHKNTKLEQKAYVKVRYLTKGL